MHKSRIKEGSFTTARPLYTKMGDMAMRWLENARERKSIVELLPAAQSVRAGKQGSGW
jgi:hypothetical protein